MMNKSSFWSQRLITLNPTANPACISANIVRITIATWVETWCCYRERVTERDHHLETFIL